MSRKVIFEYGRPYLVKHISTKEAAGICYKCAAYKSCSLCAMALCHQMKYPCYFVKVPTDHNRLTKLHVDEFDFSHKRVRHGGKVLNKLDITELIHETEALLGCTSWPLATDFYVESYTYATLKEKLRENVLVLLLFQQHEKL